MRGTSVGTSVWRRDIEGKAEQAAGCAIEREAESATPLRGGGVGLCVCSTFEDFKNPLKGVWVVFLDLTLI